MYPSPIRIYYEDLLYLYRFPLLALALFTQCCFLIPFLVSYKVNAKAKREKSLSYLQFLYQKMVSFIKQNWFEI